MGGVLIFGAYLFCSEGLTERNRSVIRKIGEVSRLHGASFVAAGDFNVKPETLEGSGLLELIGAVVVRTGSATCYMPGKAASEIDFFLVSADLAPLKAMASPLFGHNTAPHIPIELRLEGCELVVARSAEGLEESTLARSMAIVLWRTTMMATLGLRHHSC